MMESSPIEDFLTQKIKEAKLEVLEKVEEYIDSVKLRRGSRDYLVYDLYGILDQLKNQIEEEK